MTKLRLSARGSALIAAIVVALLVTMAGSGLAAPGDTTLVSVASSGEQGNLDSYQASMSGDGRFVAFASVSDNLVEGDTNGVVDVFVRDLQEATTERVSVDDRGNQQNDQQQRDGSTFCGLDISADGRYVAFSTAADNLVPNDTNAACDVFVRDLQERTTERVSVHDSGQQANGDSWEPSISADGRYVAFHHGPDDLAGSDTDERYDVYIRDLQVRTTERVSIDSSGNPIKGSSWAASVSADGRYVAFMSDGVNLVPDDNNDSSSHDVLVRDLQAGTTEKASVTSSGEQADAPVGDYPSISADGRYVVFSYQADDLVPEDTNGDTDVFVRDLQGGKTELVSVGSSGEQGRWMSNYASISADGRYVVFQSLADNLVADDTNSWDLFVRDLQEGTTELISVAGSGEQANGDTLNISSISDDGRYVAFDSYADNLVANDTNGSSADVFLHERRVQDGRTPDTTPPDTKPPTADIVTPPDGAVYVRNQTVEADYSCEDEEGGSGLKSCEGTVAKDQPIETASLGDKTFTVRATDNAGNVNSVTSTYTVAECTISGTPGDDVLEGSAGSDHICGLGGNDTLKGLDGNDELVGGVGDDTLDGGPGTDAAYFTAAPVGVTASLVTNQATGDGSDLMVGIENLIGSNHDDTLIGSGSRNYLFGRSGVDQLFGLEGADRLMGGAQDDALRGGAGDDRIVANSGSDDLFGENGADSLDSRDGVEGNDAVDGGTDADVCSTDRTEESITNCEQHLNITPAPDTTPPIATSRLVPQPNAAGWNNSNVTVTLDATDDDSGVKEITYSTNGGANQTYNPMDSILVSSQGTTTISYFATDNVGNQESPAKTLTVNIDKSAPTLGTVTPDNGQTGVSRDIEPTATFSDEMNLASLTTSVKLYRWNAVTRVWQRVPATVSVEGTRVALDPYGATEQLLAANTKCKVTVTTGARNLAGIPISSSRSWIFTTEDTTGEVTNVTAEDTSGGAVNSKIAFAHGDIASSIFAMDADGTGQANLTPDTNASVNNGPAWSPDGTKIAFSSNMNASGSELHPEEIYVMDADGSNLRRLTDNHTLDTGPAWSPDATKIAYSSYGNTGWEVCIVNADGSDEVCLTNSPERIEDIDSSGNLTRFRDNSDPVWLPDGKKIAFKVDSRPGGSGIYTMNPDGSNQTLLTADGDQADWSPDGTRMVYRHSPPGQSHSDLYVASADGSNPVNLTAGISSTSYELLPDWSPDGTRIAFASNLDEKEGYEIYVIDVDGGNLRQLTNAPGMDLYPDWQPLSEPVTQ